MRFPPVTPPLFKAVVAAALVYLVIMALFWFLQRKVLFPASAEIYRDPADMGWPFEEVWTDTPFGKTHGWWIPLENARGAVLFSHGNAGNIADRLESVSLFRELGFSVLLYDYGGYGRSGGTPAEARCYADIRAMWRHLTEDRGVSPEKIVIFGRSLGGAVAVDLAAEVRVGAVVLESTFLSVPEVAAERFWWLPLHLLCRDKFDSQAKVGRIPSPTLVVHSKEDTLIQFRHGQGLYARVTAPKMFLEIHGDHNIGFVESMEIYMDGWRRFLAEHFD